MVVLQAVATPAVDAPGPAEAGRLTDVESRTQLSGQVAAEVLDGVDSLAVVEHGFDEGVFGELAGDGDGQGPAVQDMTGFAGMGVTPSPGIDVAYDDQLRPWALAWSLPGYHCHEGIGRTGLEGLAVAFRVEGCVATESGGRQLHAVNKWYADLRRQGTDETHHAQAVPPVAEVPSTLLRPVKILHRSVREAPFTRHLPQLAQAALAGCTEQGVLGARELGFGPCYLGSFGP